MKAVLFDLDGTLVDSLSTHFDFFKYLCNKHGKEFALRDGKKKVVLNTPSNLRGIFREPYEEIYNMMGLDWNEHKDMIKREYLTYMTNNIPRLVPGIDSLLVRLKNKKMPLAVVTSAEKEITEIRLRTLGIYNLFECVVAESFTNRTMKKKPAPDMLLACARELGVNPRETGYIGDQPADMQAGAGAGMKRFAVTWGFSDYNSLLGEEPDAIARNVPMLEGILSIL